MTHNMEDSADSQQNSGQGSHTQESGDECLPANLTHHCTDTYEQVQTYSDQPKQKSSVRLILNEKMEELELPPLDEKVPLSYDFGPEPQKVSSGEDMASLDPLTPQNPTCSSNMVQEEEAVEPAQETKMGKCKNTREDNCLDVEIGERPAEDDPEEQQRGRHNDKRKKRKRAFRALRKMSAKKKRLLVLAFGLIAATIVIAAGSVVAHQKNSASYNNGSINCAPKPNSGPDIKGSTSYCLGNCFTCMDKGKCPNMIAIFRDTNAEHPIYQVDKTQPFPKCSKMRAPKENNCSVCLGQDAILICCSNITEIMIEESGGTAIQTSRSKCEIPPTSEPAGNGATSCGSPGCQAGSTASLLS